MGVVKDAVSGSGSPAPPESKLGTGNLKDQVQAIADRLSELIVIKDEDTLNEGDTAKAENIRKAGILRAASSLTLATARLLEGY